MKPTGKVLCATTIVVTALLILSAMSIFGQTQQRPAGVPVFQVDPFWPKMPEKFWTGLTRGLSVDAQDHVWFAHDTVEGNANPATKDVLGAAENPPLAECCVAAPPILEFDAAGNFVQGWGGPGQGYDWPKQIHGLHVDYKGNVWISGEGQGDHQIIKFTRSGKFILQIGKPGASKGSSDTENVNRAADMYVYPKTNELFVADGYGNRRVVVFDADTGKYKRHWGAYGNKPDDTVKLTRRAEGDGDKSFNLVHYVSVSKDDLVYVADRNNNRIQVFTLDGKFVKQAFVAKDTGTTNGTVYSVVPSADPQQRFLYVADAGNGRIRILNRQTLEPVGFFGRWGRGPGEFYLLHNLAVDSKGNVYAASIRDGRVQKFVLKSLPSATN